MLNNEFLFSNSNLESTMPIYLYGAFLHEFQYESCGYADSTLWNEYSVNQDTGIKASSVIKNEQSGSYGNWWKHLVAGGVAGAVSRTSTAPLDRLKITLQAYGSNMEKLTLKDLLKKMTTEGGIPSLWRGNGINVVKVVPELALKFMIYDELKKFFKMLANGNELSIFERFAAGSLAGITSQSIIFPLEVVKTRMVLRSSDETLCQCVNDIFKSCDSSKISLRQLIRSFYRGYIPNMLGIVPYAGIDLAVYETLKYEYVRRQSVEKTPPPAIICLLCGVLSSSTGQLVSYPLNLIRTRLQAKPVTSLPQMLCLVNGPTINSPAIQMNKMSDVFYLILQKEGFRGFYRGLSANLMKVAPSVAVTYVVYEQLRSMLGVTMT